MNRPPPRESVEDALQRASSHARNALAEGIAACRALLDAVSLLATDRPASANSRLASLARILEDLQGRAAAPHADTDEASQSLLRALGEALDAEISRWEQRAAHDREARAVLRAFLGMREILWELGIRTDPGPSSASTDPETHFVRDDDPLEAVPLRR